MKQISFLMLFLCVFINAQNFKPTVITLNSQEQETGSVIYNDPSFTPQVFEFKNNLDQTKKLGLNDIKEVSITGVTKFLNTTVELSRHSENLQSHQLELGDEQKEQ